MSTKIYLADIQILSSVVNAIIGMTELALNSMSATNELDSEIENKLVDSIKVSEDIQVKISRILTSGQEQDQEIIYKSQINQIISLCYSIVTVLTPLPTDQRTNEINYLINTLEGYQRHLTGMLEKM